MCEKELSILDFHKDKSTIDGLRYKCKTCIKQYDDSIKEKRNAKARETYRKDPAIKIKKTRAYHLNNPEWSKRVLKEWHQQNKSRRYAKILNRLRTDSEFVEYRRAIGRASESKRRAQMKTTEIEKIDYITILNSYNNSCYICGVRLISDILHWDHYKPLSKGGFHTKDNLRPSCFRCNVRKNNKWPITEEIMDSIKKEVRQIWIDYGLIWSGGEAV